jgi:hypothetical protein
MKTLGVDERRLEEAVPRVRVRVKEVKAYLGN